ncbi:CoA pyrophosphatase [Kumtagia ephedrae]|uniref:CoA pyrophosphatase n=1 Tax=Kumtagia ephedrae TaxID=2116701 RepID=A0A2P7SDS3_9HYPH|nr:CoA pyrophosphatase [Mesorhizobium ephedrae]PSJ60617.1 CoA pyrophosphatase [Mesorhizobium ephedrae]
MRGASTLYTAEDFRRRAGREENFLIHPDEDGDHRFNPGHPRLNHPNGLREAAVLIPIIDHGDMATMLLTKRAETLRNHTGQVAFPGGRVDPEDGTAERAALREAEEEIGLPATHVEVLGQMPDYVAGSGYRIKPVLSIVRPGFELVLNPDEVDAAFEVPLAFLMDPVNHARGSRFWGDREWFFYDMPYDGRRIWGVTAGIIRTLYERLYA